MIKSRTRFNERFCVLSVLRIENLVAYCIFHMIMEYIYAKISTFFTASIVRGIPLSKHSTPIFIEELSKVDQVYDAELRNNQMMQEVIWCGVEK